MEADMRSILATLIFLVAAPVLGDDAPPVPGTRLRGTIEKVSGDTVTILTRGGQHDPVMIGPDTRIGALRQLAIGDLKAGDFIGTAALKQTDGHLKALEVMVFPEALRGRGEGHRAWDQGPDSSMTNATVAEITATPNGPTLQLKYKGGEATVDVPPDAPIVTPIPGDRSLLVAGKAIVAFARQGQDGVWTAANLTVEKDGVKPPL
jgi:hypothetical protein